MKYKLLFVSLLLATIAMSACAVPRQYSAEPIEAWVVDAETSQPIEGVIVVAHWELKGGLEGGNIMGQMMVMEAVTDQTGRFSFPAWGPKWELGWGSLGDSDPALLFFKSGYKYIEVSNSQFSSPPRVTSTGLQYWTGGSKRFSLWSGRTIKMEKFKGAMEEYAEHVHNLSSRDIYLMLDFARGDKDCNWQKVPHMLVALHRESLYFESQGIKLSGWRLGEHPFKIDDIPLHCASPNEFLRSYLP